MPATYSHYSFGEQVLQYLDEDIKKLISKNLTLFQIGLHGPDILFYYKPLIPNSISKRGHKIHKENGDRFFDMAKDVIHKSLDKEAATAYTLGFICHFMLDSECHPYVRAATKNQGLAHSEIETEFDRALMLQNNIEPNSYDPTKHIIPKEEYALCIADFYKEITPKQIVQALKSMVYYLNLLVAPKKLKRMVIVTALLLSASYKRKIGLIMSAKANPECSHTCTKLQIAYQEAIIPTAKIVNDFYRDIDGTKKLPKRFERNFG